MGENGIMRSKLLRKEMFAVKCPRKVLIGDPYYVESLPPGQLRKQMARYDLPNFYQARLHMSEHELIEIPECKFSIMELYMAPPQIIEVYAEGNMYESQTMVQKPIGVDTAQYFMDMDGKRETFHTGADGYWGDAYEYRHVDNEKTYFDGVLIAMTMPEHMTYEEVKNTMQYLFEDMQLIEDKTALKKSEKKKSPER